jgi:trimeric autotransporter adhesin
MKTTIRLFLTLACLSAFDPKVQAVLPPPDGGYPGFNTAEGHNALFNLTTGVGNAAVGWYSLFSNTDGSFNTGVGAGTLLFTIGDQSAGEGLANTAVGAAALLFNTTGSENTATGVNALFSNTSGAGNMANGVNALNRNTTGFNNTATGNGALFSNTGGGGNTANGVQALDTNATGSFNTALGLLAGMNQTTGSNNVYIGAEMFGVPGESDACYIKSIFGQTSANGIPVLINSNNKLGTTTSSKRFKEDIKSIDKVSEALFSLKPVSFRYKKEIDPAGTSQLGLVAEDVEKVSPELVVRDKEGKPYSVRYDQVNAMLLNEFLKEHRTVQEQGRELQKQAATIAKQQKQIEALTAGLQKVSAQLEVTKPAPQTALNNP